MFDDLKHQSVTNMKKKEKKKMRNQERGYLKPQSTFFFLQVYMYVHTINIRVP